MRNLLQTATVFFLVILAGISVDAADVKDEKFVDVFFQTICVRCHNEQDAEGELNLDGLGLDVASGRAAFATVLERLGARDMPPEDEPQPKPADGSSIPPKNFSRAEVVMSRSPPTEPCNKLRVGLRDRTSRKRW